LAKKTSAICARAGVKQGPLFEACMIDVAMIGRAGAALIHAKTPMPAVIGEIR
jgi:hypothetical protein